MVQNLLITFFLSLFSVCWIHPYIVRVAKEKGIVDNPDARKLQRIPIPVLGGIAVFFGMIVGIGVACVCMGFGWLPSVVTAMLVLLYIGTLDDVLGLTPRLRFLVEIIAVLLLISSHRFGIDGFFGLWGVGYIPQWFSLLLTIFAAVGIINAINLIDGVDGLSSGYCVMASIVFGVFFYLLEEYSVVLLATAAVGSLIPFFFHNVFGRTSKMFIGDGGTLVMGVVLSAFVLYALNMETNLANKLDPDFGLVPFTLAVLSIPVFDTLRVMLTRIIRGTSPFSPDKRHLHHLFIKLGFSHAGATVCILTLNSLVIALFLLLYKMGVGIDGQFYGVIGMSLLVTVVFYWLVDRANPDSWTLRPLRIIARWSHVERKGAFLWLQRLVDRY